MLLFRFLKVSDFDVEKAQDLLLLFLETRKNCPDLFLERDIHSEEFDRASTAVHLTPLRKNTQKNQKISVFRIADADPNLYDVKEVSRMVMVAYDVRFISQDDDEVTNNGEIGIVDMKGYSFRHLFKAFRYMSLMNSYFKYVQETIPTVIVQNHFVNCSPVVPKMIAFMKPFMKKELIDTIKIHTSIESLYDFIPRDLLPNEYGGTAGCLDDIHNAWMEKVKSKR